LWSQARLDVDASVIASCSEDKSSQGSGSDESETLEGIPKDLHFCDQLEQAMLSMEAALHCRRRRDVDASAIVSCSEDKSYQGFGPDECSHHNAFFCF